MSRQPLAGKKIAVLMESEFIAAEIQQYQTLFGNYGADVHLMSNLWGKDMLSFHSAPMEDENWRVKIADVSIDFQKVCLDDYAAVIMAANYTSVRLRWFSPPPGKPYQPEMVNTAPAVKFFAEAMKNTGIVKGAACHALWILTPVPELLRGRRVTCNPVVLADVLNAGAIYVPADVGLSWDRQVVVDDDLITNPSFRSTDLLVDAIKDAIVARDITRMPPIV